MAMKLNANEEEWTRGVLDLDGVIDVKRGVGIRYIGNAKRQSDGAWHCLAVVGPALCLVEVKISRLEA